MQSNTFNKKLLVFPTSRAIREYLKNLKEENALLPTFLTIDEFLKKTLYFDNKKLIDEEQRFLYLKEACNIPQLEKIGFSNEFSFFFRQSDYLFRFFGEIASEKVDIETFSSYDTYEFYKEHIQILKLIYKNYSQILDDNNCIDKINLPNSYKINNDFLNKFDEIGIFFEGYFTNIEFEIIEKVSVLKKLFVNLNVNDYNKKSLENFENLGFEFKNNHNYIINLSSKSIIKEDIFKQNQIDYLIEAFNARTNQIAFIKKSVNSMIEKGIDPSRIALILPEESFAQTVQLYSNEGYFNYAMGLSIKNEKIYKVLSCINDYLNDEEQKSIDELNFFNIDKLFIDSNFKDIWKDQLHHDKFVEFFDFIKTYEYKDEIIEKLDELKFRLEILFFNNQEILTLKDAIKILIQKVSKLTLDDINSGPVTVMGLLETRAVKYDGIIIVDFNESFVPKRSVKDKFLSTAIKKHIGLPTSFDRENLQKYYYHRLISQAKYVNISYVKNETMQISRFSNELFKLKNSEIKDDSYKHILFNQNRISHFDENIEHEIDLKKFTWSATSLKIFLSCKRKFYLQYIAGLNEHTNSLKPKSYELGSIIHDCLQKLYERYSADDIDYEKLLDIFNEVKSANAYLILDLEIWKNRLKNFIDYEKNRKTFKVIDVEKAFLIDYKGFKLKGAIDRIDKVGDDYYILDYKTSSSLKVDTLKNYENTKDFQLEFYFLACKELLNSSNIKPYYYDLYENVLKNEIVLDAKLDLLDHTLENLQSGNINFVKCIEKKECNFCIYKVICNR
jgi:inactivated superfamily I helicase/RecB family exonuclease